MILTQGLKDTVEDIKDDMTNGESGTSTTEFDKSQTGVQTAIGSTDIALADKTSSSTTINLTYVLVKAVGNTNDITEFEINNTTIAYNRAIKAATTKDSTIEFTIWFSFDFEVVL